MATILTSTGVEIQVDEECLPLVSAYKWRILRDGYASCRIRVGKKQRTLYMHRLICGLDFGDKRCVDHANGEKRDNRRINLRICSIRQNAYNMRTPNANTSGIKGVTFRADRGTWDARLRANGKRYSMTGFKTKEDAGRAIWLLRQELHGEFANHGIAT